MASIVYSPLADQINLKFMCPNCGKQVEDTVAVPAPNLLAETHQDSVNYDSEDIICEYCGNEITVNLQTGYYGGYAEVESVEDGMVEVQELIPGDDDEFFEQQLYDASHTEIEKALDAIENLNDDVKQYFFRLLYANVITSMETFLGDTLKREVLQDEKTLRKFVETYKPYKNISMYNRENEMYNFSKRNVHFLPFFAVVLFLFQMVFKRLLIGV